MATRRRPALATLLALAAAAPGAAMPPTLDQEQLVYNGGTSARTLPGYSIWQSFTAGVSGQLIRIDMGFFNDMSGTATLLLRGGEGSAGPVLQTLTVPVVGLSQPGVTWNSWPVAITVATGQVYTFQITPDAATLPDPYGVCIGAGDPYPRGRMGIDDPSGSFPTDFDVVFRTYVNGGRPPDVYRSPLAPGLVTPGNLIATAVSPPYDDLAPPAAPLVLFYAVSDGAGQPPLISATKLAAGVRLIW